MNNLRYAPLLACGIAAWAGCATKPPDPPTDFTQPPQVVAIYAVDTAGAVQDVLVYSRDEPTKVSKAPPSYSTFRVEFSQPMAGDQIANASDLSAQAFCSPAGSPPPVQLVDVTGANRPLASSVCYDPTSPLGQNPHVTVVAGDGTATAGGPSPFTCQAFTPAEPDATTGLALAANTNYAIVLDPTRVKGSNGQGLNVGSTNGVYPFTTSDFAIMAIGFQDAASGYYTWLQKPFPGFMKDLAPVAADAYVQPADDTPVLVVTTIAATDTTLANITITREDGTPLGAEAVVSDTDPRIINLSPGETWEPNQRYKANIPVTVTGTNGTALPAAVNVTFNSATSTFAQAATLPGRGSTAQAFTIKPSITFNVPVDPGNVATATAFKNAAGASVAGAATVTGASKHTVTFTPASILTPETTYTLTTTGLIVGSPCPTPPGTAPCAGPTLAGKPIADGSLTFTTQTFRTSGIFAGATPASINNSRSVNPARLVDGTMFVRFDSTPSGVNSTSVKLFELTGATQTPVTGVTVAAGTAATDYTITVPASGASVGGAPFKLKFGQSYVVRAETTITDTVSGKTLKKESCVGGTDCADTRGFATGKFTGTLARTPATGTPTGVKATFAYAVDPASPGFTNLNSRFKLYQSGAGGQQEIPNAFNCTAPVAGDNSVTCTFTSGVTLTPNTRYTASMTIPQAEPVKVAPTLSGAPTDADPNSPTGGVFFQTVVASFTTPCT